MIREGNSLIYAYVLRYNEMFQIPLIYQFIMGYFALMLSYELIIDYPRLILPMSLAYQSEVAAP